MIRVCTESDLTAIMQIWLAANSKAHSFIPEEYWKDNYPVVEKMLPQAEIYVYEDDDTNEIAGFIGLTEHYIAGLFVREAAQSRGIGKRLLNYVKEIKSDMSLSVYQKNTRAVSFYRREGFVVQSENIDDAT
ncbi:MAG: GNAT family N-acetyltransferase, partial [Lachnospiraceae bacterium]|nr:GNAT family N-acetyltransferase [Lachnospiraceae bacterium]